MVLALLQVWIGLMLVIGFLPVFIYLAAKFEKHFRNHVTRLPHLSYNYVFMVGVLTTQCKS